MIVAMPYFLPTFTFREAQEALILGLLGAADTSLGSTDTEAVGLGGGWR